MSKAKTVVILSGCLAAILLVLIIRGPFLSNNGPFPSRATVPDLPVEGVITVHYHERAPYYRTGPDGVRGLCADPLSQALKAAGIPFEWRKTPPNRQLEILRLNRGRECILGWFKNPAREKMAKFSVPIYQDRPTIALARSDNERIPSGGRLEDTFSRDDLVMLTKDGYSYGPFVDEMITHLQPMQVQTTADNTGMLRMIHAGRADYFFISEEEAEELVASSGIPRDRFRFVRFSDMPEGSRRYVLFSLMVEDAVIEKINRAIMKHVHGAPGA